MASGVNIFTPSCKKEVVRDMMQMKGAFERDREAWCRTAKSALRDHPLTEDLVAGEEGTCSELDRAAGLIAGFQKHCPDLKLTTAGKTVFRLASGGVACRDEKLEEIDDRITEMSRTVKGAADRKKATALWCATAAFEHASQMSSAGMALCIDR